MLKSVKLHFSVSTNIWDFLKVSRFFSGASDFSFGFKSLPYMLKNTVLSQRMKIDFWENNAMFDQKLRYLRIFQIYKLKLRNSSFKQNGLFWHQNSLRNSTLIKLKYCLPILEILDFALLRYPKKLENELLQDFHFNSKKFDRSFLVPKKPILM